MKVIDLLCQIDLLQNQDLQGLSLINLPDEQKVKIKKDDKSILVTLEELKK